MPTNCYQTAFENATNEIAEINAQIERLTHRKELLEKLLEPLRPLALESGSDAIHSTFSDDSNGEFQASRAATQASPIAMLVDLSEPEPGPLEAPPLVTQPEVEETNLTARTDGGSIPDQDVAGLAYRFWNERGQVHGHHEEDWFRAVHELQHSAC